MAGYGARKAPSEGVADPLCLKAMAVEDTEGGRGLLITSDLISFDARYAGVVCEEINRRTGLERGQVLLNSSHTHGGPLLGIQYVQSYRLNAQENEVVAAYTRELKGRLVALAEAALADLQPARVSWGTGVGFFAMNRRKPTAEGVVNAPNPRGYVDRTVPVMRVESLAGELRGIVFGYACHNTTLGAQLQITSDYAGYAQRYIESQHPNVPALFVQGCGASANPYPRGTFDLAQQHGEALGAEVCRVMTEDLHPVGGPLRIAFDRVDMPIEPQPPQEEIEGLRTQGEYYSRVADRIQELVDSEDPWPTHYSAPVTLWQFGTGLTLVGMPGEVVCEYIPLIECLLGPLDLWIAGYCNDYFGYLPTSQVHAQGGYEARDFITGHGYLARDVEAVVLGRLRELAARVRRPVPGPA